MRKDEGFYPRLFCLKIQFVDICRNENRFSLLFLNLKTVL